MCVCFCVGGKMARRERVCPAAVLVMLVPTLVLLLSVDVSSAVPNSCAAVRNVYHHQFRDPVPDEPVSGKYMCTPSTAILSVLVWMFTFFPHCLLSPFFPLSFIHTSLETASLRQQQHHSSAFHISFFHIYIFF